MAIENVKCKCASYQDLALYLAKSWPRVVTILMGPLCGEHGMPPVSPWRGWLDARVRLIGTAARSIIYEDISFIRDSGIHRSRSHVNKFRADSGRLNKSTSFYRFPKTLHVSGMQRDAT